MMMLLPFVRFNEENHNDKPEKIGSYTAIYNFDTNHILTIEPDEDGDTEIVHRNGTVITLKIDCAKFITYLARTVSIDVSFMKDVEKHDTTIGRIMERVKTGDL